MIVSHLKLWVMAYKNRKEAPGFWSHRPGYNWLLGYEDEGRPIPSEGMAEVFMDRKVKDCGV